MHTDGPSWAYCDRCGYYHNDEIDCDSWDDDDDE